jgi:hypothetical protein
VGSIREDAVTDVGVFDDERLVILFAVEDRYNTEEGGDEDDGGEGSEERRRGDPDLDCGMLPCRRFKSSHLFLFLF